MSYTIRTCKECGQKLHVRQIGRSLQIKNRCKHFKDELVSSDTLDMFTVPIDEYRETIGNKAIPHICCIHKCRLQFIRYMQRSTELYHCPKCAVLHSVMSKDHIRWWIKKTWNKKWKAGDVKLIVGQNRS